jgi:uncharacterized membrane protein
MTADSATKPETAARRRLPRWLWVVLIASLAVNLFVVGVVARVILPARYAAANGGAGGLYGNLQAFAKELPQERRAQVRQSMPRDRPQQQFKPLREETRAARREAGRIFRAEPFNKDEFLAAEARVQAAETKLRQTMTRFAAELASRMTAEERSGFLKWRELRRPGGAGAQAERDGDGDGAPKKTAE